MPSPLLLQVRVQAPPAPASPSAAPAASAAAAPSTQVVVGATTGQGTIVIPTTRREIEALKQRREELSNQLNSAAGRRRDLERRLPGMDAAARSGVEQRIALLDNRILNLESQIDQVGQQLAAASPATLAESQSAVPWTERVDPEVFVPVGITFTMFVLAPIAFAMSRYLWKRSVVPPRPSGLSAEAAQRLDRIENAVDAIAIEVERVSEGQRFLTRLFTEGREAIPGLGAGERPAEPIKVGRQDSVGVPRSGS